MSFCQLQQAAVLSRFGFVRVVIASLVLVVISGCGGGYSGPTGTVSGTVTLNGEPVPSGSIVSFVSDDSFVATAVVDAGGSYNLEVAGQGPKIPTATYKVMVSAPATGGISDTEADYEKYMESVNADTTGSASKATGAIPARYASTATSDLSFPINAGENTINIDLK